MLDGLTAPGDVMIADPTNASEGECRRPATPEPESTRSESCRWVARHR